MSADDEKATKTVLQVLSLPAIGKLKFSIDTTINTKPASTSTRSVDPSLYQKVAKAITGGDIKVIVQPNLLEARVAAKYYHTMTIDKDTEFYDLIVLRAPDLGRGTNAQFHAAAAIVHECTHAGFDLLKLTKMTHLEHEAASYVAGALFVAETMLAMSGKPEKVTPTPPIEKAAWQIALLLAKQSAVPRKLHDALGLAIRADPVYKGTADDVLANDGVGRQWKIKKAGR